MNISRTRAQMVQTNWLYLLCALSQLLIASAHANEAITDTSASPFAKVQAVGLDEARWTRGFWADRFELCRTQMVMSMALVMEGTNYSQFYRNFEILAGLKEGRSRGASFNDGDFYKFLEGATATLAVTNNERINDKLDEVIDVIAKGQETNGYIDTWVQLHQRAGETNLVPLGTPENFEVYNLGQLMTAACVHYRVTGKTNFLAVARKAADFLAEKFENLTPALAGNLICPSHYMGIVELYRATAEPRYLDLAKKFFAARDLIKDGAPDNQTRIPFAKQDDAEGHAVRANYLYAGAADLFLETGDTNLWKPLSKIWTNVVTEKMYITGGCGALYDGASPDGTKDQKHITRVHQAYGRNYQLPNTTAHNETCANIGNVLWNWRMFLATGDARFMDVIELTLYNSVLSGVALDGTNYFYTNPLRVTDPLPTELRWSRTRVPFVSSFCCPPNLVRTIAESADYTYGKTGDAILVNLYGGSALETKLANGDRVKLAQETEYPWSGRVRIKIADCGTNEFALKLRIPGWAKDASARINNKPAIAIETSNVPPSPLNGERAGVRGGNVAARSNEISLQHKNSDVSNESKRLLSPSLSSIPNGGEGGRRPGEEVSRDEARAVSGYYEIRRVWRAGDFVDLDLPMPVRYMEANPLVEEDTDQVAVQRGPVIYCIESPDLPKGVKISDVFVPHDMKLSARYDHRLLDGVVVLEGKALARARSDWEGKLYRELQPDQFQPINVRFIPYSVWQNRGPAEMSVWFPRN